MTNPHAALRMLITYAVGIPLAVLVGYLLTNPLDYGTLGFLGLVLVVLLAPVFIKWHYPILVFGLNLPMTCFFLVGKPPAWEVVVLISLTIAVVERCLGNEHRFLRAPAMTWALVFTALMTFITMELTGGMGLHALGGGTGGGKKYIQVYVGVAMFFALISRGIPPAQRGLYVGLFLLSGAFAFISDMFPFLPSPLNLINLLFPPTMNVTGMDTSFLGSRLISLAATCTCLMMFLVARYGLRGILSLGRPWRLAAFAGLFAFSLFGGQRAPMVLNLLIFALLFFLEGLHRTRWLAAVLVLALLAAAVVIPFSRHMPYAVQRTLSFLPVDVDPDIRLNAEDSTEWRLRIWQAVWPKVPDYLLLGKGYYLTALDYESMGSDNPFAANAKVDASLEGLAISSDFHSGPISVLISFGLWGAISILALFAAGLSVVYRNYKYGPPELATINAFLLATVIVRVFSFFFVYGAFSDDVPGLTRVVGFSVALNWGVCRPGARAAVNPLIKPQTVAAPQAA